MSGAGNWYDSTYVTIRAVPRTGYKFSHWNDGDTCNPRRVMVAQDTVFEAKYKLFGQLRIDDVDSQKFSLAPNPAHDVVVLKVKSPKHGRCAVVVYDASGREVMRDELRGDRLRIDTQRLNAGTYFVTLHLPDGGAATQRLVVE